MKTARILWGLALLLLALPARAELPDYVLERDYQNCVGQDQDPTRAMYCDCVRTGMRQWDDDTYAEAALQAAALASNPNAPPSGKIADLAQQCISKVLH